MHKYVLSFCVGLELFTGKSNKFWINFCYIFLYAVMSPIGIGIGIGVSETANDTVTGKSPFKVFYHKFKNSNHNNGVNSLTTLHNTHVHVSDAKLNPQKS